MNFDLEHRITWFDRNHYAGGEQVIVEEKEKSGKATVSVTSADGNRLMMVNTTEKNALAYLNNRKVADGTICELINDHEARLHLIECKKTVTEKSWSTAMMQFEGGLLNMLAVCGVLGVRNIFEVRVYTAFQTVSMDARNSRNPVALKTPVGSRGPSAMKQWDDNQVHFQGKLFEHVRIELNADGEGSVTI